MNSALAAQQPVSEHLHPSRLSAKNSASPPSSTASLLSPSTSTSTPSFETLHLHHRVPHNSIVVTAEQLQLKQLLLRNSAWRTTTVERGQGGEAPITGMNINIHGVLKKAFLSGRLGMERMRASRTSSSSSQVDICALRSVSLLTRLCRSASSTATAQSPAECSGTSASQQ